MCEDCALPMAVHTLAAVDDPVRLRQDLVAALGGLQAVLRVSLASGTKTFTDVVAELNEFDLQHMQHQHTALADALNLSQSVYDSALLAPIAALQLVYGTRLCRKIIRLLIPQLRPDCRPSLICTLIRPLLKGDAEMIDAWHRALACVRTYALNTAQWGLASQMFEEVLYLPAAQRDLIVTRVATLLRICGPALSDDSIYVLVGLFTLDLRTASGRDDLYAVMRPLCQRLACRSGVESGPTRDGILRNFARMASVSDDDLRALAHYLALYCRPGWRGMKACVFIDNLIDIPRAMRGPLCTHVHYFAEPALEVSGVRLLFAAFTVAPEASFIDMIMPLKDRPVAERVHHIAILADMPSGARGPYARSLNLAV